MAYGQYFPQRTANEIVLYLSAKQPAPGVPFELQGSISPDVWAVRLPTITKVSERYSRPLFERIWFVVGFLATIIVPSVLYNTILSALHFQRNDILFSQQDADIFLKARAITGAIGVGLILLFAVPMIIWKAIGRKQVNRLLQQWARSDQALVGNSGPIPVWKVRTPGVFSDSTVLTITLPLPSSPTSFHPSAYLPSYINPPQDAGDSYFYPYRPGEPGLPRMSIVGNAPPYTDEKQGYYEDIKV